MASRAEKGSDGYIIKINLYFTCLRDSFDIILYRLLLVSFVFNLCRCLTGKKIIGVSTRRNQSEVFGNSITAWDKWNKTKGKHKTYGKTNWKN